jgi:hypothetical protein
VLGRNGHTAASEVQANYRWTDKQISSRSEYREYAAPTAAPPTTMAALRTNSPSSNQSLLGTAPTGSTLVQESNHSTFYASPLSDVTKTVQHWIAAYESDGGPDAAPILYRYLEQASVNVSAWVEKVGYVFNGSSTLRSKSTFTESDQGTIETYRGLERQEPNSFNNWTVTYAPVETTPAASRRRSLTANPPLTTPSPSPAKAPTPPSPPAENTTPGPVPWRRISPCSSHWRSLSGSSRPKRAMSGESAELVIRVTPQGGVVLAVIDVPRQGITWQTTVNLGLAGAGLGVAAIVKGLKATNNGAKATRINVKHLFHGEINKGGKAVGFHHAGSIGHQGKARISSIVDPANAVGVYRAKVEVFNEATGMWVAKASASTFFPDVWTRAQVLNEVRGAFGNQLPRSPHWAPNYFEGLSPSGVRIGGYLDTFGDINTSFPIY